MTDRDRRISDQLVRLVQIIFGLVLAQSLLIHRDVIVQPVARQNWIPMLALFTVYVTTVLSWIDWHVTMELRPYNFNPRNPHRMIEQFRLSVDLLVVAVYAYLLFTIEDFKRTPEKGIADYLLGFPAVFAAYLLSGLARRWAHGTLATNPRPILVFGFAYLLLYLSYRETWIRFLPYSGRAGHWIDGAAIGAALILMLSYRLTRGKLARRRSARKSAGLTVGIDVDGVLANQIDGIIPRVRARLGIGLRYEDVTQWRLPLGESDIAKEIAIALEDPDYVLSMPLHNGARETADELYQDNRVIMITARPPGAKSWTDQWLHNHAFTFDEFVNVKRNLSTRMRHGVREFTVAGSAHS
jgi:hypothetical protein